MRILIATGLYPPEIGGPATHTRLLEEELPKREVELIVLPFSRVRKLPKVIRHLAYFVLVIIQGWRADIVYALDPVSVGFPSMLAATVLRKKFIVRIAGDYAWEQGVQRANVDEPLDTFAGKTKGYPLLVRILKRIQTRVARSARQVIVPSKYLKKIVSEWGVSAEKISVIYNSFSPPKSIASKAVLRQLFQFDGKLIVSIGRLVPWKGFSSVIELMPTLLQHVPQARLVIVGSGPDEARLTDLIEQKKLQDQVSLTGQLDKDTMLRYLRAADCFVLNTRYEGFSHQILEALALSVPVVTTNVCGNPEIINHGKNGLLVAYNDKKALTKSIQQMLTDTAQSKRFVYQGEITAKRFTTAAMIEKLLAVMKL